MLGMAEGAPQKRSGFKAIVGTLLVIVLILLVFSFFAARTDGFRSYLENEVQKRTGIRLLIGKTRIGWPYDLVMENVKLDSGAAGAGELTIQEASIGLAFDLSPRVMLRGCHLSLVEASAGEWQPEVVSALGPLQRIGQVADLVAGVGREFSLEVRESDVRWSSAGSNAVSEVRGLTLLILPKSLPRREVYCFYLTAQEVLRPGGSRIRAVEREWLSTTGKPYIEISYRADWGAAPDAADLWSRAGDRAVEGRGHAD